MATDLIFLSYKLFDHGYNSAELQTGGSAIISVRKILVAWPKYPSMEDTWASMEDTWAMTKGYININMTYMPSVASLNLTKVQLIKDKFTTENHSKALTQF